MRNNAHPREGVLRLRGESEPRWPSANARHRGIAETTRAIAIGGAVLIVAASWTEAAATINVGFLEVFLLIYAAGGFGNALAFAHFVVSQIADGAFFRRWIAVSAGAIAITNAGQRVAAWRTVPAAAINVGFLEVFLIVNTAGGFGNARALAEFVIGRIANRALIG